MPFGALENSEPARPVLAIDPAVVNVQDSDSYATPSLSRLAQQA